VENTTQHCQKLAGQEEYIKKNGVVSSPELEEFSKTLSRSRCALYRSVIGIGAGVAAVGAGLAFAASGQPGSMVFAYGGYYYCRKHRVPLLLVGNRLWCPIDGRFIEP
jgi:hypothetical protein